MTFVLLTASFLTIMPATELLQADRAADRQAVEQAAMDYIDGIYLVDPSRIQRSVHPLLTKRGFWREAADDIRPAGGARGNLEQGRQTRHENQEGRGARRAGPDRPVLQRQRMHFSGSVRTSAIAP